MVRLFHNTHTFPLINSLYLLHYCITPWYDYIKQQSISQSTHTVKYSLYASKEYMFKDICTESINIIYVQLYANYYVKQRHISIISFHIAPAPNNWFSTLLLVQSFQRVSEERERSTSDISSSSLRRLGLRSGLKRRLSGVVVCASPRGSVIILPLMGLKMRLCA